jgi:hypothetical protein
MIRNFILIVLVTMGVAFAPHEYFVSVTEAEYSEDSQTFQMTMKFIGHDLEKALSEAGVPELNLGTVKEDKSANKYILDYINKTFQFSVNEKKLTLQMVGNEVGNDDFIYCYIETEKVRKPKNITIENSMLTEVFAAQENIVYLTINTKKNSFSFNKDKRKTTLNIE